MEKEPKRGFLDVLKEFAESSTLHGVPKVVSSRQLAVKVLWCILLVLALCAMLAQLFILFRTYRSYPIQTTVSLEFGQLQFPAISFCNMNPVRKSMLNMSPTLRDTIYPKRRKSKKHSSSTKVKRDIVSSLLNGAEVNTNEGTDFFSIDITKTYNGSIDELDFNKTVKEILERFGNPSGNFSFKIVETVPDNAFDTLDIGLPLDDVIDAIHDLNDTVKMPNITDVINDFFDIANGTLSNDTIAALYEFIWDYDDYWEHFDPDYDEEDDDGSMNNVYDVSTQTSTTKRKKAPALDAISSELLQDPKDKWETLATKIKTRYREIPLHTRKEMGHQKEDLIQQALFSKREQNITKYFQHFPTTKYGNCYTLASNKYRAVQSGLEHGIQMTFYIEVDEYIENHSSGYGVRMVFHQPGTLPLPTEEGLTINPEFETFIGLRAINITRLGHPYGICTEGEDFNKKYNITYSKPACLEFCRILYTIDLCGCKPYNTPDLLDQFEAKNISVCKDWDTYDEYCMLYVSKEMDAGNLACDCINPCSEIMYQMTLSGRTWPNKGYLEKVLMRELCDKYLSSSKKACYQIKNDSAEFNYNRYKNNFARVHIYFEDLNYERITEEPSYSPVRFISDIGGAVGLFLGCSLLSLFEILQLLLEIILYLCHRENTPTSAANGPAKV
ncbi:hypothetical protein ACF0H5_022797 [Mactra antiquata]